MVKRLGPDASVSYHLAASDGGLVFPRDFVLGVKFALLDGCFVAGGRSVEYPPLPPEEEEEGVVRAWNHPSCMVVRSEE